MERDSSSRPKPPLAIEIISQNPLPQLFWKVVHFVARTEILPVPDVVVRHALSAERLAVCMIQVVDVLACQARNVADLREQGQRLALFPAEVAQHLLRALLLDHAQEAEPLASELVLFVPRYPRLLVGLVSLLHDGHVLLPDRLRGFLNIL